MPALDGVLVLHAGITASPCAFSDATHQLARLVRRTGFLWVRHPMRCPVPVFKHRTQKIVGQTNAKIFVLEHHRAVSFAVEVTGVTLLDQGPGFSLFALLGINEFLDIRVPDFERIHLRRAPGLAAGFHHARNGVVHAQKRHRPTRATAAGKSFAFAAQRREISTSAAAILKQHRFAPRQLHDIFHLVTDRLDETC